MIAEEKRRKVLDAIAQVQDEQAFAKFEALVEELLAPAERAQGGFLRGSVSYKVAEWDAPLPDTDWAHNAPSAW